MSININQFSENGDISGLPDVTELEKLANELFSLLPNEMPKANFSPDLADHPRLEKSLNLVHDRLPSLFTKGEGFNVNNPQPVCRIRTFQLKQPLFQDLALRHRLCVQEVNWF